MVYLFKMGKSQQDRTGKELGKIIFSMNFKTHDFKIGEVVRGFRIIGVKDFYFLTESVKTGLKRKYSFAKINQMYYKPKTEKNANI